jgi:hypothetical protein
MRAACTVHLISIDFITLIIFGYVQIMTLHITEVFQHPVASSPFGPNIL